MTRQKVRFKVEANVEIVRGKRPELFIIAECLEVEKGFEITGKSKLGGVEIHNYLNTIRATDKEGKRRLNMYVFKMKNREDFDVLKKGEIVHLSS